MLGGARGGSPLNNTNEWYLRKTKRKVKEKILIEGDSLWFCCESWCHLVSGEAVTLLPLSTAVDSEQHTDQLRM